MILQKNKNVAFGKNINNEKKIDTFLNELMDINNLKELQASYENPNLKINENVATLKSQLADKKFMQQIVGVFSKKINNQIKRTEEKDPQLKNEKNKNKIANLKLALQLFDAWNREVNSKTNKVTSFSGILENAKDLKELADSTGVTDVAKEVMGAAGEVNGLYGRTRDILKTKEYIESGDTDSLMAKGLAVALKTIGAFHVFTGNPFGFLIIGMGIAVENSNCA